MGLLFQYIDMHFAEGVATSRREHMFHLVLGVFERYILLTHKCVCWTALLSLLSSPSLSSLLE